MTINYESIGKVLEAWAKPAEDEICQQVRVAWLMENWPELGKALQDLVPVEYKPLMNAEEMAAYVHEQAQEIVDRVYKPIGADIPVQEKDDRLQNRDEIHDFAAELGIVNEIANTSG